MKNRYVSPLRENVDHDLSGTWARPWSIGSPSFAYSRSRHL